MISTVSNNVLTIVLPPRLDTSAAQRTLDEISELCAAHPHTSLVLDASQMEYISSSGLRIILLLAKREPSLRVTEVSQSVFDVFQMTGFDRIIPLSRRIRSIVIDGCTVLGKGGVGTVYRLTDDTIIKVFRPGTPLDDVQREINLAREALVFGLPTAISFELVRVGDQYGIIHELINAQTLAQVIREHPDRVDEYGAALGRMMRNIHAVHDDRHVLPSAVDETHAKLDTLLRYFSADQVDKLRRIYDAIPLGNSVLHCDLHPKNVMLSAGELMLIDMGEVCCGNPLEDLSHTYSAMKGLVGDYPAIVGMDEPTSHRCFDALLRAYLDTSDPDVLAEREEQIRVASLVRNFTWLALSPSFPEDVIAACRVAFADRVESCWPRILDVLPTLSDFPA